MFKFSLLFCCLIFDLINADAASIDFVGRDTYEQLCREDTRGRFPPSLNDQIATYEHAYDLLLKHNDTSGFKPIVNDGYRYFVKDILASPEKPLGAKKMLKKYHTEKDWMLGSIDYFNARDAAGHYIPFLITTYFFNFYVLNNHLLKELILEL